MKEQGSNPGSLTLELRSELLAAPYGEWVKVRATKCIRSPPIPTYICPNSLLKKEVCFAVSAFKTYQWIPQPWRLASVLSSDLINTHYLLLSSLHPVPAPTQQHAVCTINRRFDFPNRKTHLHFLASSLKMNLLISLLVIYCSYIHYSLPINTLSSIVDIKSRNCMYSETLSGQAIYW